MMMKTMESNENNIGVMDYLKEKKKRVSKKDEIMMMTAMMNDSEYNVDIYTRKDVGYSGKKYYPGREFKKMINDIILDVTKIPERELSILMDNYEFNEKQAKYMVDFSKEFLNSYVMECGRKIGLGGREKYNIYLSRGTRKFFDKIKIENDDGNDISQMKFIKIPGGENVVMTTKGSKIYW